ncbi:MAG: hypothetical protein MMC33_005447 [Icmadophila ericetorum]|nr:hypothetical protein [Icmadophila ericetorum]
MITNTYVSLREWFYPIGNTPAVNLLRHTTFSKKRRNIELLLLACGDPRNILFSLYCQDGLREHVNTIHFKASVALTITLTANNCTFNFTCCDHEPAVLARNIVLLTLVADQPSNGFSDHPGQLSSLWNIFYHVYIPRSDIITLQKQSRKLMELAKSTASWSSSSYGKWINFLDEDTRARVSNIWSLYARTESFTKAEEQRFELRGRRGFTGIYETKLKRRGIFLQGSRAAGAHTPNAVQTMSDAFELYWKTGVVGGNAEDIQALDNGQQGCLNPMFAVSSASNGDFAMHYGSDPLIGFHLAEVFNEAPVKDGGIKKAVAVAKTEFRRWCLAFSRCLSQTHVQITLYYGEAIRLCYGLQAKVNGTGATPQITHLYKNVWSSVLLTIDEAQQATLFDIIDTSNLVDHVGILNVLPASIPLLKRQSSSVLYTETLLATAEDPEVSLSNMLCSDVDTIAIILGLTPVGRMTGVSLDSYATETLLSSLSSKGHQQQFRIRIPWKVATTGDMKGKEMIESNSTPTHQISMDAVQLAHYFFKLYLKMFEYEDWSKSFAASGSASMMRQLRSPLAADLRYYTRISVVKLIHITKNNVATNWPACTDLLVDKIEADQTLMIGVNSVQELCFYMHTFGLWEHHAMMVPPKDLDRPPYNSFLPKTSDVGLLGQQDLPTAVFVALAVPRSKLSIFTDGTPDSIGTPGLHLSVHHGMTYQNSFFALQCFFGRLKPQGCTTSGCEIEEDVTGWSGYSDLIAVCQLPVYTLLMGPREQVRVGLVINTTPSTVQFSLKLGPSNTVFEAGLDDERRVCLYRDAPTVLPRSEQPSKLGNIRESTTVKAALTYVSLDQNSRAFSLAKRSEFGTDMPESKALKEGAGVSVRPISACNIELTIERCSDIRLEYPYAVDGANSKSKVSRKNCWVEVTVPIASAMTDGGYKANPFPVIREGKGYLSWALPRINLSQQPILPFAGKLDWVNTFVSMALSERERELNRAVNSANRQSRKPTALLELKESLHTMFIAFAGQHPNHPGIHKNFQLVLKENRSCDTIILASAIRHDLDAGSIFLDAYVIPLTGIRLSGLERSLEKFLNPEPIGVTLSAQEEVLWKHFLPAIAERCRTWEHDTSCSYNTHCKVPLSTAHGENPLCSCGEGKMSESFPGPDKFGRFRRLATRVAIPVLFAVPYVESVIPQEFKGMDLGSLGAQMNAAQIGSSSQQSMGDGCNNCGTVKPGLKACGRCGKVKYCNHACQKGDWKEHKKVCGKL